ncbi:MAG: TIGR02757 family protein [Bacteroidales bacterium]|nr:TIGR02757 family protein [Bacteroidales bacterium]
MDNDVRQKLLAYADLYETASFIEGDPSWFMHQVQGDANREATAFMASALSYGSRKQFMPKVQQLLDWANGDIDGWLRSGTFKNHFVDGDSKCFYRLYNCHTMNRFLSAYSRLLTTHGTMGQYVASTASTGLEAVRAITSWFAAEGDGTVVPKDTTSACKRVCMFLRWMVRTNSPVDLGLWTFIGRDSLIMPLDTHVLQQACSLGLLNSRTATMHTAIKLTQTMAEVFPGDPLRGDFALFGYGVNND